MHTEHNPRPSRLLRVNAASATQPGARAGKSRFVAPQQLPALTRTAIASALAQANLGDRDAREVFLTAAEYEIGAFRLAQPEIAALSSADMQHLGQTAQQLLSALRSAPAPLRERLGARLGASDPFGRTHDARYFEQLEWELTRILQACAAPLTDIAKPHPHCTPLITALARIYCECFEVNLLAAETLVTFAQVLTLLGAGAKLHFPSNTTALASCLTKTATP